MITRLDVQLRQLDIGTFVWRHFDVELEPRWGRWRVSHRTPHGVEDIGTVYLLGDSQDLIAEWLHDHPEAAA